MRMSDLSNENYSDCWMYPKEAVDELIAKLKADIMAGQLDVQINGTSIVDDGVANIPLARFGSGGTAGACGLVSLKENRGFNLNNDDNSIFISYASPAQIKAGTNSFAVIMAATQHQAVFYGLAKLAGADMKDSSNAVGTYTDEAKAAIAAMLGLTPLPAFTTTDAGKVLKVNAAGTGLEWATDETAAPAETT